LRRPAFNKVSEALQRTFFVPVIDRSDNIADDLERALGRAP
jgi:hypothetical protein